jgi:TolA-binding protein
MIAGRSSPKLDLLDLSTRARRAELSSNERREFERALEADAMLLSAHQVGRAFDAALRVRPGDEAVLERATKAALGDGKVRLRRRKPFVAVFGLAATLVFGSAGAAVRHGWKPLGASLESLRSVLAGSPVASTSAVGAKHARSVGAVPASAPAMSTVATAAVSSTLGVSASEPSASAASTTPEGPASTRSAQRVAARAGLATSATSTEQEGSEPPDAAALFRAAGAARRSGDLELAKRLYATLQARFPQAEQAHVACVSLGKLWLAGGDAGRAEHEFGRYLASGGGALAEEALVGRAQSLAALGEPGEERRVWLELLTSFGSGVYAARAKERLDELARATSASP